MAQYKVGPAPSVPTHPLWAWGTASSALSNSLRPVGTRMCSDSLAFSRCGLLGTGSCVRTDTCALGVPGARPGWVGWAGGGSQMCLLDLEQAQGHAFDNNKEIFLFCPNFSARASVRYLSKALSLQTPCLLPAVLTFLGVFADRGQKETGPWGGAVIPARTWPRLPGPGGCQRHPPTPTPTPPQTEPPVTRPSGEQEPGASAGSSQLIVGQQLGRAAWAHPPLRQSQQKRHVRLSPFTS